MKLQGKQKAAGKKQSNTPWPAAGVAEGGQYLKSRRFTPQNRGGGSSFSKAGATRLKTGGLYLSKQGFTFSIVGATRLKNGV